MTRVDFYISDSENEESRILLACRIAEKAYNLSNRVYIHTSHSDMTSRVDDMLWTYSQGSFIPHCTSNDQNCSDTAVVIGHESLPELPNQVLINLADQVPGFCSKFERIAEIVAGAEQTRDAARERYRYYRERGYPLETHNLKN